MGGWSDGSDGAGLQKMPKVTHVQMMVMMMMIGDVQTNEANYALYAQGCPCSVQSVRSCKTFGEHKIPSKVRRVFDNLRQMHGYCAYLQIKNC